MKKRIILSLTAITLSLSVGISLSHAAESSPAQIYVDQVIELDDEAKTAAVIMGVQAKLTACQQMESEDCNYYTEILSLLSPMEVN